MEHTTRSMQYADYALAHNAAENTKRFTTFYYKNEQQILEIMRFFSDKFNKFMGTEACLLLLFFLICHSETSKTSKFIVKFSYNQKMLILCSMYYIHVYIL